MKAAVKESCTCGLTSKPDIWMCPHHIYRKGAQEFISVSKVKKALLPEDYSAVDPVVLECARLRGVFIDTYLCEYLVDSSGVVAPETVGEMIEGQFPREGKKHADDTVTRINRVLEWWHGSGFKFIAAQKIVYSEADGVAGTMDLDLDAMILDAKCVSSLQPNYKLQLGAYVDYYSEKEKPCGILHVQKDRVRLVKYDAKQCRAQWRNAVNWYGTLAELQ